MKTQTTIKNIRNNWKKVFYCGYCDLQYIYFDKEPQYYNAGVYGWNCDIYCDYGRDIAITTGYRNMTGKRIPDELIEKYTENAKKIINKLYWVNGDLKKALDQNREGFLNELDKI